jgi:hypothetical protein
MIAKVILRTMKFDRDETSEAFTIILGEKSDKVSEEANQLVDQLNKDNDGYRYHSSLFISIVKAK